MRKIITSLVAFMLVFACAFTFTSCHKQNATVATYKNDTITSGMYLIFLINSDNAARTLVDEQNADNEDYDSSDVNYYSMQVTIEAEKEGKEDTKVKFKDYVRDEAEKSMKQYFYTKSLADEKKITLTEDEEEEAKSLASYYWYYYGYSTIYEPNSVSYESYENYILRQQLNFKLFKELYKAGGEKGVTEEKLKEEFENNYLIADTVNVTLTTTDSEGNSTDMTDDEKKEIKDKLDKYAEQLNAGKITFEEVYKEYNGDSEITSSDEDAEQPKDKYAVVYGSEDTSADNTNYDTIKKLYSKNGAGYADVIENETTKQYSLVVTADITKDEYYYDNYLDDLTNLLYNEEYTQDMKEASQKIEIDINSYELNYLKPQKIDYQTAS